MILVTYILFTLLDQLRYSHYNDIYESLVVVKINIFQETTEHLLESCYIDVRSYFTEIFILLLSKQPKN